MLERKGTEMKKVILKIDGMSCSGCQNRVEKYLNSQDGVSANVNLVMANAVIEYDETKVTLEDLDRFVEESGYKSLGIYQEKSEKKTDNSKTYLMILGILMVIWMYLSMFGNLSSWMKIGMSLLVIPYILLSLDILKSGISKLLHKNPNMDSLVSLGVIVSVVYSIINLIRFFLGELDWMNHLYFESAAMILYFIKLGRYIDKQSKEKTKKAIEELVQITPESAIIRTKEGEKKVTIDEIKKGDIVIARPGMKIAVDGSITKGETHLEEAFIIGESTPNKKKIGDKVIAGAMNIDGYIEYKAERIGPESTISEIVHLVVEATATKAPIQKIADKVSSYFIPLILGIAVLSFIGHLLLAFTFEESLLSFITVLLISCPCALGLATPLAMVVSEGKCAQEGILIKNSEILENAHKVDTILLDKTGTLTYGRIKVSELKNNSKYSEKEILEIVSSLERKSSHPIATAFEEYNNTKEVSSFKNIVGKGIYGEIDKKEYYVGNDKILKEANIENTQQKESDSFAQKGCTCLYVVENNKIIALIGIKDIVRENAKQTIQELKELGKNICMVSGDQDTPAKIIADELGIEKVYSNVLPKEKEEILENLKRDNHKVMMVGDGINDAPSLAKSDIGVSMNGGTDIAGDSADIMLMRDDLSKLKTIFQISTKTVTIIKQNLFWAFAYNIIMIPIAIGFTQPMGITITPMIASIAMTISSLTVVLNSLRLR